MTSDGESRAFARPAAALALVCAATVGGFLAWSWPLALHLSTHTLSRRPAGSAAWEIIAAHDQNICVWSATENARSLVRADVAALLSPGQCYPMPYSAALGEHMIELGILAAPWWLLSRDPIASFNLSFVSALLAAATGMFLLLRHHSATPAAALAGALAFAFAAPRLADLPYHPIVVGTHWIPWVLWSFDTLLERSTLRALLLFALSLVLAALVGAYPLLTLAVLGSAYGMVALVRTRPTPAALLRCAVAAVPAIVVVSVILATYVRVQHEWTLAPASPVLVHVSDYLPLGRMSVGLATVPGLVALVLLRGAAGRGAVTGLAVAASASFLLATRIALPGGASWSAFELLSPHVAVLQSVRAPGKVALGVCLCLQALAAFGWSRWLETLGTRAQAAALAVLIALVAIEASPPSSLAAVLGTGGAMELREIAPPRDHLDALRTALAGAGKGAAVLDLPPGRMMNAPRALLDAAYHGLPTSACYVSRPAPTIREIETLAARRRSTRGIEEIAAAGFAFVIERRDLSAAPPDPLPEPARLITFTGDLAIWALPARGPVEHDAASLEPVALRALTERALEIEVANRGATMWAAPRPLEPLRADVELAWAGGRLQHVAAVGLAPLALAPGATWPVHLELQQAVDAGAVRATVHIEGLPHGVFGADLERAAAPH